jgi:hypothetical protein
MEHYDRYRTKNRQPLHFLPIACNEDREQPAESSSIAGEPGQHKKQVDEIEIQGIHDGAPIDPFENISTVSHHTAVYQLLLDFSFRIMADNSPLYVLACRANSGLYPRIPVISSDSAGSASTAVPLRQILTYAGESLVQ